MKIALSLFVLWLPLTLSAQVLPDYVGAQAAGKAGCSLFDEAYGSNPASFATQRKSVALHHGFRYTPGLNQTALVGSSRIHKTGIGVSFSQFGFTHYRNLNTALAAARKLNEKCDLGIQLGYGQFSLGDRYYSNQQHVHGRIGLKLKVDKKISLAGLLHFERDIHGNNPFQERIWLKTGLQYKVSGQTGLEMEFLQDFESRPIFRIGLEYEYQKKWQFRSGISDQADGGQAFIGTGFRHKKLRYDFASGWHPQLGFLPQISLMYAPL